MKKLFCWLFGHSFYVIERFNKSEAKMGCKCCKKQFAINTRVQALLEWDSDFEQLYYH